MRKSWIAGAAALRHLTCLAACLLPVTGLHTGAGEAGPSATESVPARVATSSDSTSEVDSRLERLLLDLTDADVRVRLRAVRDLADVDGDRAAEALATAALDDPKPAVREEAILVLSRTGHDTGPSILERALTDPNSTVCEAAIEALIEIGGAESARALALALRDEDPSVREEAVYALGVIGGPVSIGILQQALSDEQASVREAAAEVLANLEGREP